MGRVIALQVLLLHKHHPVGFGLSTIGPKRPGGGKHVQPGMSKHPAMASTEGGGGFLLKILRQCLSVSPVKIICLYYLPDKVSTVGPSSVFLKTDRVCD